MKIFLFNPDQYQDYLADLINYHLIQSEHNISTNFLPEFLFDSVSNKEGLYGKGFTVYGKIDKKHKDKVKVISKNKLFEVLNDEYFDLVIFTSIRRTYDNQNIQEEYFDKISQVVDRSKLKVVDGEDDNIILNDVAKKVEYFKRELLPSDSNLATPISFSFPEYFDNYKNYDITKKTNLLAPMDPRFLNSYIFDEEGYYSQYSNSIFAVTTQKNGWDCMRHYEILASGCLPYFPGINEKPKTIMQDYPVKLQIEVNQLFEKLLMSPHNIDSEYNFARSTKSKQVNRVLKKMSSKRLLENNLKKLQNYNNEFGEWLSRYGKSNIYSKIFDLKN